MEKLKEHIQSVVDVFNTGNLSKAELLTKKLINNNPKVVFLYNLLGLVLAEQKKTDQAIKCYEDLLKIDGQDDVILNKIALCYCDPEIAKYDKAIFYLEKVLAIDDKNNFALSNMGLCYEEKGENRKALLYFEKKFFDVVSISPIIRFACFNFERRFCSSIVKNPSFQ